MKTSAAEFLSRLEAIQNNTTTVRTTLPSDEPRFIIDLNRRNITIPEEFTFLGVLQDTGAETIYFECDRYFDYVDLSEKTCIVQFVVEQNGKEVADGIFPVTYYDVDSIDGKIIFGWTINSEVTQHEGDVSFAVRFYSIKDSILNYSLNTTPSVLPVVHTLDVAEHYIRRYPALFEEWNARMEELYQTATKMASAKAPAISEDGTWLIWNNETQVYEDSGVVAQGTDGGYYTPSVSDNMLFFVPSKSGMPAVPPVFLTTESPGGDSGSGSVESIDAEKVIFSSDLITTAPIGNITLTNGQATISAAGKNLKEVWDSIFVKEKNPTITQPSIVFAFSSGGSYEAGTSLTPTYEVTLSPGLYSYGPATGVVATEWSISDSLGNLGTGTSGSFPQLIVDDDTNYTISAQVTYGDGVIPKTNLGNDYAAGQIKGKTKSATSSAITGYRNSFWGTLDNKNTLTSDTIRGLSKRSNGNLAEGATFDIDIGLGALRVVIAYPATLHDLTSVKDSNGLSAEIVSSFTSQTMEVAGLNGHAAVMYKVYVLEFATANDVLNTYTVTI